MVFLSLFQNIFCSGTRDKHDFDDDSEATECAENSQKEKYLVLDLDETLIHASFEPFKNHKHVLHLRYSNKTQNLYLSLRPYAHQFLRELSKQYKLIIYTASSQKYCEIVLKFFGIRKYFEKVFDRESCVETWGGITKDLSVLNVPLDRSILVDDCRDNSYYNPDNFVLIPKFEGEEGDHALLDLIPFLKDMSSCKTLSGVDSRYEQYLKKKEIEGSETDTSADSI